MNFLWFVEDVTLAALHQLAKSGVSAFFLSPPQDTNPIYSVAGDVATVRVEGLMTMKPSFWARYLGMGNTTYGDIEDALARADADTNVKRIELHFNTPGGQVDGCYDTMGAIAAADKPTKAMVGSLCASAGYFLASQTDEIVATSKASRVGSVGVRSDFYVSEREVTVTNKDSPNKAPDVATDAGRAVVQRQLDAVFELFIGAVADGRSVTRKKAVEQFGRGDMLLADEAKKRGMIDAIGEGKSNARADAPQGPEKPSEESGMADKVTLESLRTSNPDVYAEAVAIGRDAERKRARAHLRMGESSGDMDTAMKAIREGTAFDDAEVQAEYMSAGMKKAAQEARGADDTPTGEAANGAGAPEGGEAAEGSEIVVAEIERRYGKPAEND